ncbi:hypothetical protein [Clostridium sp.]|uniref:hypothetical protein n=1 Tax=Clostridium sp. TaxID=1506 RepID=UPI003D6D9432
MKKMHFKIRNLIFIAVLVMLVAPFILWRIIPKKSLDIVMLNKTFPVKTTEEGKITELDYSKQSGLFWIMDYLRIKNPSNGSTYDSTKDYYGNFLSQGKLAEKPLDKLKNVPDIIYLGDTYGTGNSKINGVEPKGVSGLTENEVGLIATCHAKGTTVIGEYNISGDPTKTSVSKELENIFAVGFTGWAGKFFSQLSSVNDVPNWIRLIYEKQYGRKWNLTGSGIVIAGNSRIIILQQGVDFTGKSINLSMTADKAKAFNTGSIDYYNWFEITVPKEEKSVIAWYDLKLTTVGNDQMKPFGLKGRFPAVIANISSNQKSYYFAGDFCDYREPEKIKSFLGATNIYRKFSINSEGDNSYFYWNFYVPFMSKVIKETVPLDESVAFKAKAQIIKDGTQIVSKVDGKYFSVYEKGAFKKIYVKGVDIGNTMPGITKGSSLDDNTIYKQWFEKIAGMNANCIRVYDLMRPGFYRELDIYNSTHPDKKLYLFQNISAIDESVSENFLESKYNATYKRARQDTINAIHGNVSIKLNGSEESDLYINDVSGYLLGYLVDPGLNPVNVTTTDSSNPSYKYKGVYVSSGLKATPTESWLASLSDEIYEYEQKSYNMQHPIAITSIPELDTLHHDRAGINGIDDRISVDINNIDVLSSVKAGFFGAYNINSFAPGFMAGETENAKSEYAGYTDYMTSFMNTQKKYPVLISGVGLSTSMGVSQVASPSYKDGQNSETVQGEGLVSMMKIIKDSGCMGGLIYEWADEWGKSGEFTSSLMIPNKHSNLWHNMTEPAQNYGILALESQTPKNYDMTIRGSGPMQSIAYTSNESYFYIKADFSKLPDFNQKNLMIYLDTVDRKKGEYMLAPDVNENWSGVEYNIKIQNKDSGELLVEPTYNASKGSYFTTVSTNGIFDKMLRQLSIAGKTTSGKTISAKYGDGSTLVVGNFDDSTNNFYFEGNTLFIRIPWGRLNFTDPSSLLVLDDNKTKGVLKNKNDALSVRMTDGIVASLIIMDKTTKKIDYHFPESVTASGYKTFSWSTWNKPSYVSREKKSYDIIKKFFAE